MPVSYHEYIPYEDSPLPIRINYGCRLYEASISRNYSHPWHEQIEILYFHQGDAIVFCGNKSYDIHSGDIIFINPCETHHVLYKSSEPLYDCLMIDADLYCNLSKGICETRYFDFLINGHVGFENLIRQDDIAVAYIQAICKEFLEQPFAYEIAIKAHIFGLLSHFFRNHLRGGSTFEQLAKHIELYDRIKPAIEYMRTHLSDSITLSSLAHVCNLSRSHFCRLFRQITNTSPIQYLFDIRLSEVVFLLKNSDKSITQIASETGFDDVAYLSRTFKKKFQISPVQFRKQNRSRANM